MTVDEWPLLKSRPKRGLYPDKCESIVEACVGELLRIDELPMNCVVLVRYCGS
ncbi:MAG: hypothetical protein F7C08_01125 [Desulfurococcales archaeon]|nr:hypothetical protein [Desulfurococcales archaeon]MCE4605122.1 hypothetical protein [Desulfurococcales archaeon]